MDIIDVKRTVEENEYKVKGLLEENLRMKQLLANSEIVLLDFGMKNLPDFNVLENSGSVLYFMGRREQLIKDENRYLKSIMKEHKITSVNVGTQEADMISDAEKMKRMQEEIARFI